MSNQHVNPPTLFNSLKYGFSQAVVVPPGGRTVFFSGQVGMDEHERMVSNDLISQTREALHNLDLAARASGCTLRDVVMIHIYIVQPKDGDTTVVGKALREFFGTESPPASSWIGVHSLARKEFLIEIEAVAVIS
jgi:enamine deaminase RidA (YjgF/YER057c/UK114 family)